MRFHETCIHRPVFTVVLSLVVVIIGAIGMMNLGIREYPAVDPPVITINANYRGASAEVVESQITEPIEAAVNTVAGIRTITSSTRDGASRIRLEFKLGTNLDAAANDVRDQLSRAARSLPTDADPPALSKAEADSGAILTLVLRGEGIDPMTLTEWAEEIREQLQIIPNVGSVDVLGEKRYSIKILLDPDRLTAHGLTPTDVAAALRRESVELPGGRIENSISELNVQTLSRLSSPAEFARLIVLQNEGRTVRLGEVARAELLPLNERISFTVGGVPMIGVAIRPQPGANQVAIVDEALRRLPAIRASLPEGVALDIASDNTRFVRQAISELRETIIIALLLVVGVISVFLGSLRVTLIPAIVIPISLVGTFFIMWTAGFSINVLTLLGLVLAVGLVVDDAIVVVENIHRRRQAGLSGIDAAVVGTGEVYFAVIATTLTLLAVFSPILFMQGLSGQLFREFGFVIGGAVLISSFVALTLTPMMAARIEPPRHAPAGWWQRFDNALENMRVAYRRLLGGLMDKPWIACTILIAALATVYSLYRTLPSELAPLEDRNGVRMSVGAPEGVSYEYMQQLMLELEAAVGQAVPEANVITCQVPASGARTGTGVANTGLIEIALVPKSERTASQSDIARRLTQLSRDFPAARINVSEEPSVGDRRSGNSVQYVLRGTSAATLRDPLETMVSAARDIPAFGFVDTDLRFTRPGLEVSLDRDRMQTLGVAAATVAATLQAALSEQRVGYFTRDGRQYEILQQLAAEYRNDPQILKRINVRTTSGQLIPLDNLAVVDEQLAMPQRFRFNRQPSATITARLASGSTMAQALQSLDQLAAATLPPGITTALSGAAAEFRDSERGMLIGFALSLIFVFLVLAAQFESWRAPLIILLTVPLALVGALLALWYFRQTLNIFSQIGIIMLVGLITKNGILVVEFALQKLRGGASPREAALDAAATRLRPILMTTVSTALGVLPIALSLGAGAESRVSMGIAVLGGLLIGSSLTLFVIPVMFRLIMGQRPAAPPCSTKRVQPFG
jgi:multidrug efflux pump